MNIKDRIAIRKAIYEIGASDEEILDVYPASADYIKLVRNSRRAWTEDEVEILKYLVEDGMKSGEIAELLERSTSAVQVRCSILGIKSPSSWTEDELEILSQLVSSGLTHAQIGLQLNRSTVAITNMCSRSGIKSPSAWSADQLQQLRQLVGEGLTSGEIGLQLNRTASAVQAKCSNLGIKSLNNALKNHEQYIDEVPSTITVIGNYVNNYTKIDHQCKLCNTVWCVKPNSILSGKGCPTCSSIKRRLHWDKDKSVKEQALLIEDYLYIMQCDTCIMVGVGNDPEKRLKEIKSASADQSWHIITTLKTNVWGSHILDYMVHSNFKCFPSTSSWPGHTKLHYIADLAQIKNFIAD